MNVPEYVAEQTERVAESLCQFLASTREDRRTWRPTLDGAAPTRSVLEQISECVQVNHLIAAVLRGEQPSLPQGDLTFADADDARRKLTASAADLAAAIRTLTPEDMDRTFQHPRAAMLGKNIILAGLRNMAYHAGQTNLIQMLYGDSEFHVPSNWR